MRSRSGTVALNAATRSLIRSTPFSMSASVLPPSTSILTVGYMLRPTAAFSEATASEKRSFRERAVGTCLALSNASILASLADMRPANSLDIFTRVPRAALNSVLLIPTSTRERASILEIFMSTMALASISRGITVFSKDTASAFIPLSMRSQNRSFAPEEISSFAASTLIPLSRAYVSIASLPVPREETSRPLSRWSAEYFPVPSTTERILPKGSTSTRSPLISTRRTSGKVKREALSIVTEMPRPLILSGFVVLMVILSVEPLSTFVISAPQTLPASGISFRKLSMLFASASDTGCLISPFSAMPNLSLATSLTSSCSIPRCSSWLSNSSNSSHTSGPRPASDDASAGRTSTR